MSTSEDEYESFGRDDPEFVAPVKPNRRDAYNLRSNRKRPYTEVSSSDEGDDTILDYFDASENEGSIMSDPSERTPSPLVEYARQRKDTAVNRLKSASSEQYNRYIKMQDEVAAKVELARQYVEQRLKGQVKVLDSIKWATDDSDESNSLLQTVLAQARQDNLYRFYPEEVYVSALLQKIVHRINSLALKFYYTQLFTDINIVPINDDIIDVDNERLESEPIHEPAVVTYKLVEPNAERVEYFGRSILQQIAALGPQSSSEDLKKAQETYDSALEQYAITIQQYRTVIESLERQLNTRQVTVEHETLTDDQYQALLEKERQLAELQAKLDELERVFVGGEGGGDEDRQTGSLFSRLSNSFNNLLKTDKERERELASAKQRLTYLNTVNRRLLASQEEQVARLRKTVGGNRVSLRENVDRADVLVSRLRKNLNNTRRQLSETAQNYKSLVDKYDTVSLEAQKEQRRLSDELSALRQTQAEADQNYQRQIEILNQVARQWKAESDKYKAEAARQVELLQQLQQRLPTLETTNSALSQQIARVTGRAQELDRAYANAVTVNQKLVNDNNVLRSQLTELVRQLEDAAKRVNEVENLEAEKSYLQKELNNNRTSAYSLNAQIDEQRQRVRQLENEVAQLRNNNMLLEQNLNLRSNRPLDLSMEQDNDDLL